MTTRGRATVFVATFLKKLSWLIVGAVAGSLAGAIGTAMVGGLMMLTLEGRRYALGAADFGAVVGGVGGVVAGALHGLRFFGDDED